MQDFLSELEGHCLVLQSDLTEQFFFFAAQFFLAEQPFLPAQHFWGDLEQQLLADFGQDCILSEQAAFCVGQELKDERLESD